MLKKFEDFRNLDLAVGSRHVSDGKAEKGFSFFRSVGSKIAIKFTNDDRSTKLLRTNCYTIISHVYIIPLEL